MRWWLKICPQSSRVLAFLGMFNVCRSVWRIASLLWYDRGMASSLQILREGDRSESSEADAFAFIVAGIAYLAIACAFYVGGSAQWAEATAVFGLLNWVRAAWPHRG
jgi:hypothetical protein